MCIQKLVHVSSFLMSLSLAHPAEAMLIQADWFQPDAPELAPGVAVMQVARGVRGGCMTVVNMFYFVLGIWWWYVMFLHLQTHTYTQTHTNTEQIR